MFSIHLSLIALLESWVSTFIVTHRKGSSNTESSACKSKYLERVEFYANSFCQAPSSLGLWFPIYWVVRIAFFGQELSLTLQFSMDLFTLQCCVPLLSSHFLSFQYIYCNNSFIEQFLNRTTFTIHAPMSFSASYWYNNLISHLVSYLSW